MILQNMVDPEEVSSLCNLLQGPYEEHKFCFGFLMREILLKRVLVCQDSAGGYRELNSQWEVTTYRLESNHEWPQQEQNSVS